MGSSIEILKAHLAWIKFKLWIDVKEVLISMIKICMHQIKDDCFEAQRQLRRLLRGSYDRHKGDCRGNKNVYAAGTMTITG